MAMIYDTNLGWIDEPPWPTTRYWKLITRPSENKSPKKTPIIIEDKKKEQAQLQSKSWIQTP